MSTTVWVKLFVKGEERYNNNNNEENIRKVDSCKIQPIPEDVHDLKKAVKIELQPKIDHASVDEILVYPIGTKVTSAGDVEDRNPYRPGKKVAELGGTDDDNPLIVVAPPPPRPILAATTMPMAATTNNGYFTNNGNAVVVGGGLKKRKRENPHGVSPLKGKPKPQGVPLTIKKRLANDIKSAGGPVLFIDKHISLQRYLENNLDYYGDYADTSSKKKKSIQNLLGQWRTKCPTLKEFMSTIYYPMMFSPKNHNQDQAEEEEEEEEEAAAAADTT